MIDSGELDWKLIAINSEDPLVNKLNDINDIENLCPGVISGIIKIIFMYIFIIFLSLIYIIFF
jgi:inorganic pyrophosphatase